jgi:hypothetical protein
MPVSTAVCIHAHVLKNLTHTLRDTAGLKPENFPMSSTSTAVHASKSMVHVPNEQPRPHIRDNNIRYSSTLSTSCGEALGFRKYSAQLFLRVNSIRRTLPCSYGTRRPLQAGYTRIVYIGFSFKKSSRLHVIGPSCICTIRLLDSKGCMGTVSARRRSLYIEGYLNLVPLHACISGNVPSGIFKSHC